jgi:hypothetical protein
MPSEIVASPLRDAARRLVRITLFGLLVLNAATLSAAPYTDQIGYREFQMIGPDGYLPTSMYFPEIVANFQRAVPPGLQVEEVFLTAHDRNEYNSDREPALDRTAQVQVLRAAIDKPVSQEGLAEVAGAIESGLDRLPAGMSLVGIDAREPWGLFYTVTTGTGADMSYAATGMVLVNHQLLNLVHYVDADVPRARELARDGVIAWARALRAENPDQAWIGERAGRLDPAAYGGTAGPAPGDGGSLAGTLGRIAGMLLALYLVYRIFRRRT